MPNPAFLGGLLAQERHLFNKVVNAVLDDSLDYRPDPKSRSSKELIEHILGHNLDMIELIDDGVIHHRNQEPFDSLDEASQRLDESFATLVNKLGSVDEGTWGEPATFYLGDQVIMEAPRQQLAWILFLDAIHHRGQLTTHLRVTGSKVPALYGPSADDTGEAH